MNRHAEVRMLLSLSPEALAARCAGHLVILESLEALHQHFAGAVVAEIKTRAAAGAPTRLILPVGPTGGYPILAEWVNRERISLRTCWFFFMDEYADHTGCAFPAGHPLSFKGTMERLFFSRLAPELAPPPDQVVFPDEMNIHTLAQRIDALGGIDTCYGGIGIHGHLAFNEPEPQVSETGPRLVYLNAYTVTINAVRAGVGGNLEGFPHKAYTLGMRQILGARRIRLYCRNDGVYDWANTVLRLAVLGAPGDDYPVTYIRGHADYSVITDRATAASPGVVL
ncbi:MAG: glucosamine-6-phosphate isomerase [Anaerolineae bacterium]|nr:glucosamine-6-phosphate isomerase [Anaerolineae bacterium]